MFTAIPKVQVAESAPKQMNAQRTYNTMWNCVPSQKEQNYLFHIKKARGWRHHDVQDVTQPNRQVSHV